MCTSLYVMMTIFLWIEESNRARLFRVTWASLFSCVLVGELSLELQCSFFPSRGCDMQTHVLKYVRRWISRNFLCHDHPSHVPDQNRTSRRGWPRHAHTTTTERSSAKGLPSEHITSCSAPGKTGRTLNTQAPVQPTTITAVRFDPEPR